MSETDVLIKQLTDVLRTARELSSDLTVVGRLLEIDGAAALTKSRVITELVLHRLCVEAGVRIPRRPTVYSLLDALSVAKALPEPAKRLVQTVSLYANAAAHHRGTTPTMSDVAAGVAAMLSLVDWAAEQGLVDSAMTAQPLPIQRGDRVRHLDNPIDIFFVHLVIEPVVEQGPALCRCTLMEEEQPIYSFLDTDLERVDAPTVSQAHREEEPDGAHLDPSLYPTPVHAPGTFVWHRQSGERDLYRVLDHLFPLDPGGFILTSCEGHTLLDDAKVYNYPEQELIPADISMEDAKEIDTHYQVTPPPDPDRPRSFLEASKIRVRWVLEREVQRD